MNIKIIILIFFINIFLFFNLFGQVISFEKQDKNIQKEIREKEELNKKKYPIFVNSILKEKEYLLNKCESCKHAQWKPISSMFKDFLGKATDSSEFTESQIKKIYDLLTKLDFGTTESIFLEDPIIINIVIKTLYLEELFSEALRTIIKYCRPDFIKHKSNEIKGILLPKLKESKSNLIIANLCMLNPNENEKKKILKIKNLDRIYRAKLGDKKLEKKFISLFEKAKSFSEKSRIAEDLGFIGTKPCAKSLLKSFNSNLVNTYGETSIRMPIMKSLARIHPGNNLFKNIRNIIEKRESYYCIDYMAKDWSEEQTTTYRGKVYVGKGRKDLIDYSIILERFQKIISFAKEIYKIELKNEFTQPYIRDASQLGEESDIMISPEIYQRIKSLKEKNEEDK